MLEANSQENSTQQVEETNRFSEHVYGWRIKMGKKIAVASFFFFAHKQVLSCKKIIIHDTAWWSGMNQGVTDRLLKS